MNRTLWMLLGLLVLVSLALPACTTIDVTVPDDLLGLRGDGNGDDYRPRQVPPADPGDPADLQRENRQLRAQVSDLQARVRRLEYENDLLHERLDELED